MKLLKIALLSTTLLMLSYVHGAQLKVSSKQKKAHFIQQHTGIFKPLDLLTSRVNFYPTDHTKCGKSLTRKLRTLEYTCKIKLPKSLQNVKLKKQISDSAVNVTLGTNSKRVNITTSSDAHYLTFDVKFDKTSIDFQAAHFNDDLFSAYSMTAYSLFKEAMKRPLVLSYYKSSR